MKKFTSLFMLLVMISLQLSPKPSVPILSVDYFCSTENEIIPFSAMTNDLKELPGDFGIPEEARGSLFSADVGVYAILDPNSGINLDSSIVVIQIKNYGAEAQTGIPWEVNWSGVGAGTFSGTYANILGPGGIATFYVGMANLIMYGEYYFEACTSLAGDLNPENDCTTKTVINIFQGVPMINLYIYGCLYGDQFTSWNLANIDIPSILCEGTPPWYQNFANHIHEFTPGQTYALTITVGYADTYFDIWIDFDDNRDLNDNDELIFDNGFCPLPDTSYTFYITIPENAPNGLFHMRARTNWTNPINPPNGPYNTYEYGICCDFRANISDGMVFPLNPPENLQAECLENDLVLLTWEPPSEPGNWLQWCSDQNNDGIGLNNGGTFTIASRWDADDLAPFGNLPLKKVALFPRSDANANFTLKVFKGSDASTLLLSLPLANLDHDEWNVIVLPNPVLIDPNVDLWVGFEITHEDGDMPAGADAGPAIVGKGDMVSLDGITWEPLSSFGLDYNWNIKAFVAEELDLSMNLVQPIVDLSGGFFGNASSELVKGNLPPAKNARFKPCINPDYYKIYRDNSLIASVITGLSFVDIINPYTYYTYYVTAFYNWVGESIPSNEYTVSCGWTGQAAISFNPEQIFEMHIEQNMVTTQILNVSNTGSAPLHFMITIQEPELKDNQQNQFQREGNANNNSLESLFYPMSDWLSVLPLEGSVLPLQTMPVELTFNSNSLVAGTYNTILEFTSNAVGAPHTVPVTLFVEITGPIFHADKEQVITYHPYPSMVTTELLTISNLGDEPLIWEVDIEYPYSLVQPENPNLMIDTNDKSNKDTRGLCIENLYSSGCSFGDQLTSWELTNITVPIIPCSGTPPWYQDFTDKIHGFEPGQTYVLYTMAGYADTYFDVWIDFNGDEQLTADELVINDAVCSIAGTIYSFILTIPVTVAEGTYLMRARTNWQAPVTDPCATYQYGQAIDFKANIFDPNAPDWLSAAPLSGTINPGDSVPITVTFNTTNGLPPGIYSANLKFTNNAPGSPHSIPAMIYPCFPPGLFIVTPFNLLETHIVPPAQVTYQNLTVNNLSDDVLDWSVAILPSDYDEFSLSITNMEPPRNSERLLGNPGCKTSIQIDYPAPEDSWLSVFPTSGSVLPFQTEEIVVSFNSQELPAGMHQKTLFFTSAFNTTAFVEVELEVVVECTLPPPTDLVAQFINYNPTNVLLNWVEPSSSDVTIRWDDGANYDGIGLTVGGTFTVAARWTPDQLTQLNGMVLKSVDFFPRSIEASYVIKVWKGEGALIQVVEQQVAVNIEAWTNVVLDTPVEIDASEALYIGYTVSHLAGDIPAGCDSGPAIASYGDLVSLNPGVWESMFLQYGLNSNWNIAGNLEVSTLGAPSAKPLIVKMTNSETNGTLVKGDLQFPTNPVWSDNSKILEGYDIKRNGIVIDQIGLINTYTDYNVPAGVPTYQVGARYTECTAWSENASPPPSGVPEIAGEGVQIRIFPNPATDFINIFAVNIRHIRIFNNIGKIVFEDFYNSDLVQISTSNFSYGIYLVNINTEHHSSIEKLIIR